MEPLVSAPQPIGIGTAECESLSSFVQRLAAVHGTRPGQLVFRLLTARYDWTVAEGAAARSHREEQQFLRSCRCMAAPTPTCYRTCRFASPYHPRVGPSIPDTGVSVAASRLVPLMPQRGPDTLSPIGLGDSAGPYMRTPCIASPDQLPAVSQDPAGDSRSLGRYHVPALRRGSPHRERKRSSCRVQ